MNLEEKLRQLQNSALKNAREANLENRWEYLQRRQQTRFPAQRAPRRIEEYVEGRIKQHSAGEFFLAEQALPPGRPYGKMRIADIAISSLNSLNLLMDGVGLPEVSRLAFLDTETTGLIGDTGTCAFLIGLGMVTGAGFVVRQYFLRDYADEKAALGAVGDALAGYDALVTFNGKNFDVPLLESRYALSRRRSPFHRLVHLDLLPPARRLWKLRVESCQLTWLERKILGVARDGDVPGSEIPGIYFDYLRTGDARGLQPVFFHNALDILSLAALTAEMAMVLRDAQNDAPALGSCPSLDLFSLSRIFAGAGATELSISMARRAVAAGLPEEVESCALWHMARQHKRRGEFDAAARIWMQLTNRDFRHALAACRELAVFYEHRMRDTEAALEFTQTALAILGTKSSENEDGRILSLHLDHFTRRRSRLEKRLASLAAARQRAC